MKEEEIIEGNETIALFDGRVKDTDSDWWREFDWLIHQAPCHHRSQLKYHSSWDWLMKVIDKIEILQGIMIKHYKKEATVEDYNKVYELEKLILNSFKE